MTCNLEPDCRLQATPLRHKSRKTLLLNSADKDCPPPGLRDDDRFVRSLAHRADLDIDDPRKAPLLSSRTQGRRRGDEMGSSGRVVEGMSGRRSSRGLLVRRRMSGDL